MSMGGAQPRLPQSGTFSANPMTMTAGHATMTHFDAEAVHRLNKLGRMARLRIGEAIARRLAAQGAYFRDVSGWESPAWYAPCSPGPPR